MKLIVYSLLGLCCSATTLSCQQNKHEKNSINKTAQTDTSTDTNAEVENTAAQFDEDPSHSHHIDLIDNFGSLLRHKISGEADTLTFTLSNPAFVNIDITTAADTSNIRINQVITPLGDIDGPFGKTVEQEFQEAGTYQLIIAESLMQGSSFTGKYRINVLVSKN